MELGALTTMNFHANIFTSIKVKFTSTSMGVNNLHRNIHTVKFTSMDVGGNVDESLFAAKMCGRPGADL